jgi:iron complex outermembrane receptor protein
MIRITIFLSLFFIAFHNSSNAQTDSLHYVKGVIKDDLSGEPIIGATISYSLGKGTQTDLEGNYILKLQNGVYTFTVSYIGYKQQLKKISVNKNVVLLNIDLSADLVLNEVEIVADVAKIRETPVAISNVSTKQIQEELAGRDLPMLLNSTPGVYASQSGGGAGDSRVNIRGFSQNNIGVLVDGVPVNDMENGSVYWSNWSGLSEVTRNMQVQRGLGASRLALPSVGGTMNIITMSIDEKRMFVVKSDLGTNNYRRISLGYNSGMIKNKFGVTLAGSYTGGDGWVDRTYQKTWSYFAKIMYRINKRNLLTFGVNGAPQEHGQKSTQVNMAYNNANFANSHGVNTDSLFSITNASNNPYSTTKTGDRGLQFNPDWGYVNGKAVNTKVNFFHKPLFNLNYFLTINDKLTYSNVLYASFGTGGGTSTTSNIKDYDQKGSGQLLLQLAYDLNSTSTGVNSPLDPNQKYSSAYIYASMNNHKWYGTLSTLKWKVNKNMDFTGGVDARYYVGTHYQTPYNLLGGDYVFMPAGKDQNLAPFIYNKNNDLYIKKIGDKINYYYSSKVTWLGLFTQLEYKKDKLSLFLTLTGNQSTMQNVNYFGRKDIELSKKNIIHNAVGYADTLFTDGTNYGVTHNLYGTNSVTHNADGSITFNDFYTKKDVTLGSNYSTYENTSKEARTNTTILKTYYGYTIKGGANYKLTSNHNVFINLGYMNLAPRYNNVFDKSGTELKNVKNQLILSAELGYGLKYEHLAINVNGYITQWGNKPLDFPLTYTDANSVQYYYNVPGVDAKLKGLELDFSYKALPWLKIEGFGMIADWRWNSGGSAYVFSNEGTLIDSVLFDAKNLHIANAPQQQLGGSLRFEPFKGFYFKPQYTFFNKMYAQFDPTAFKIDKTTSGKDYRNSKADSWRMPAYGVLDFFLGYTIKGEKSTITINASMNNVLNIVYMTDASYSQNVAPSGYSNPANTLGYMGMGRRINVGVKVSF